MDTSPGDGLHSDGFDRWRAMSVCRAASVSAVAACVLVAAAVVSACSAGEKPAAPSSPSTSSGSVAPSAAADIPASVANDVDRRKHAVITSCRPGPDGGWEARGTVTNSGQAAHDYSITIFFTTENATVLDHAATSVTVEGGATGEWSAQKNFPAPPNVLCVLRGVG
ncbi:hypothetical protein AB0A74_01045 [Saccharothrix sp. NPDC042600]|uniref:hypothetical protein n=1 Tax=Saccharothrix TaxID=2071 RepID=UPI0033DA051C